MQALNYSERADTQLWGLGCAHAMNISDEIVTWWEWLGGEKADVGGVSTAMYKLRPLATIWETGALLVPEKMLWLTQELNRYQASIWVNTLANDRIIPVYGINQYGYSGAIMYLAPDIKSRFDRIWVDKMSGFIESKTLQEARNRMWLKAIQNTPYEIVNTVNSKTIFLDAMVELWVPVAYGKTVYSNDSAWEAFYEMEKGWAKQVYAKLSRAASWQWVFPVDINKEDAFEAFLSLPQTQDQMHTLWVRIDFGIEWIVDSPNLMMNVWQSRVDDRFISASSQLLAKKHESDDRPTIHKWNISWLDPLLLERLVTYSQSVWDWMRELWAYGIVGLDYVVTRDGNIYIMEANYRVNGGLAAAMKAHDLSSPYWAASWWVKVPANTTLNEYISHLQKSWIEYNRGTNSGVIVLNHATSPAWTMQIAVLWNTQTQIKNIMAQVDIK
jgi:hypothetical protein